jgi:hypothetical protein
VPSRGGPVINTHLPPQQTSDDMITSPHVLAAFRSSRQRRAHAGYVAISPSFCCRRLHPCRTLDEALRCPSAHRGRDPENCATARYPHGLRHGGWGVTVLRPSVSVAAEIEPRGGRRGGREARVDSDRTDREIPPGCGLLDRELQSARLAVGWGRGNVSYGQQTHGPVFGLICSALLCCEIKTRGELNRCYKDTS